VYSSLKRIPMTNKQYSEKFFVMWIINAILFLCSIFGIGLKIGCVKVKPIDGLFLVFLAFAIAFASNTYWFYKLEKYFANKANLLINS